jgi:hypothetical protein
MISGHFSRTSHSLSLCSGSCSADGSFVDHMFYELHGIVLHTAMAALAFLTQNFILAAQSFQFGGGIFLARRHGRRIDQTIPAAADPANQRRSPDSQIFRYLTLRPAARMRKPHSFILKFRRKPLLRHRVHLSFQENSPLLEASPDQVRWIAATVVGSIPMPDAARNKAKRDQF